MILRHVKPLPRTGRSRFLSAALLAGIASLLLLHAAPAQTPPAPSPTPAGEPVKIPYNEDPNVPGLSREERIKRQEAYIKKRIGEAAEKRKQEQQQRIDQAKSQQNNPSAQAADAAKNVPASALKSVGIGKLPAPGAPGAPGAKGPAGVAKPGAAPAPGTGPASVVAQLKRTRPTDDEDGGTTETFALPLMTLYVYPGSVTVQKGKQFSTECRLLNLMGSRADRVDLLLSYPPLFVEPVSIHQDAVRDRLAEPPVWGIDRASGLILYRAKFSAPVDSLDMQVIEIVWRAIKPTEDLDLSLKSSRGRSAAYLGEHRLTENYLGDDGLLMGGIVRITEPGAKAAVPVANRLIDDARRPVSAALTGIENPGADPPALRIRYDHAKVYEPGQWVKFEIELDNPDRASFDDLRLVLSYDPAQMEIIDTDDGNWIREGVNILDGPFRDDWKWNVHLTNEVDEDKGRIVYHMGTTDLTARPSGVLVRILGRIKALAADPLLTWVPQPAGSPEAFPPGTAISLLGKNLLAGAGAKTSPGGKQTLAAGEFRSPELPQGSKADPSLYRSR